MLNWIYAWQRFDVGDDHAERLLASLADQVAARPRATSPRAQPPHARAVRAADRRPRVPGARPRSSSPSPSSTATSPRTSAPTASTARPRRTTTRSRCARSSARARTPAATGSSSRPASTSASRAPARSWPTARARTARSPRSRTPTPATTPRCSTTRQRDAQRPASPTAATTCSAAAGTADARFLIFDCGPLGDGGHGHYDLLSFEAHGGGRPLVVDPGRGSYSEAPPNLRRWFRGTAAHNTVCVDGLDQTPYSRGRPPGRWPQARFLGRETSPGLDVLAGEAISPPYEAVHRRRIAFVDDAHWIVEDQLEGEREHRFDLRFHLAPGAQGARGSRATPCSPPGLALTHPRGGATIRLEPGWVAPSYGASCSSAPVVSASRARQDARSFVTRLVPERALMTALLAPDPARAAARRAARRAADGGAARRRTAASASTRSTASATACASSTGSRRTARRTPSPGARSPGAARASTAAPPRASVRPGRCPRCCTRASSRPCSGRSRTTAGSPACGCSTAARRARPAASATRSRARG